MKAAQPDNKFFSASAPAAAGQQELQPAIAASCRAVVAGFYVLSVPF